MGLDQVVQQALLWPGTCPTEDTLLAAIESRLASINAMDWVGVKVDLTAQNINTIY